jgi:hypothetical protein
MKRRAEVLALGQDRAPAQAGLKAFQTQLLEQALVVADREAPFGVVVVEKLRCRRAPAATRLAIGADDGCAHRCSGV